MNQGLQTVKNIHSEVYQILPELMTSMIDLTRKYEQKPLNNINKQFQDCIMNYFFEDYVGEIIKNKFQSQTKTYIKDYYMSQISNEIQEKRQKKISSCNQNKQKEFIEKKYMLLPQKYIQEIFSQKKENSYVQLLVDIALEKIIFPVGELRWRSQIRKKSFAALLLVHFYNNYPTQTIFEMWDNTFPSFSLKKQKNQTQAQQSQSSSYSQLENTKQNILIPINNNQVELDYKNPSISNLSQLENQFEQKMFDVVQIGEPHLTKKRQLNHYFYNFPTEIKLDFSNVQPNMCNEEELSISNNPTYDSQSIYDQSSSTIENHSIFIQNDENSYHYINKPKDSALLCDSNLIQKLQQNLLPFVQNTQIQDNSEKNTFNESEFNQEQNPSSLSESLYSQDNIEMPDEDFFCQQVLNQSALSSYDIFFNTTEQNQLQ